MNINFVFTNYNNSLLSVQAIESIFKIKDLINPYIVVVDNCSNSEEVEILKSFQETVLNQNIHIIYLKSNIGYFKGLNEGLKFLKSLNMHFDYYTIGNNDLIFPENYLHIILKNSANHIEYPVVAPNLITLDNVHQNPHVATHISKFRKLIYSLYYTNYNLAKIINYVAKLTRNLTKRKDVEDHYKSGIIFMGYGACYLLTSKFFQFFQFLDSQTFLMGEEAFFSNQIHSKNLEIYYDSEIKILHHDHASCGKIPAKKMWQYSRDSYKLYKSYI